MVSKSAITDLYTLLSILVSAFHPNLRYNAEKYFLS